MFKFMPSSNMQEKPKHTTYALAGRYAKALITWVWAGRPMRNQQGVEYIYDTFCLPCEYFTENDKEAECAVCGCRLHRTEIGIRNKLALATTSCPADIPKWVTGEKYDEEGMSGREEELFEEYQNICDKEINHEKPE